MATAGTLTPSLPWCHLKTTHHKGAKLFENHQPFLLSLAPACERIFVKMHSTENRCVIRPENILFVRASGHLSARKCYRLVSEGVNWLALEAVVVTDPALQAETLQSNTCL